MEAPTPNPPGRRASTMGWLEYAIGGAAVLISAISLQVAVSSNRTQERMMAASTWPHVQYVTGNMLEDGTQAVTLSLANAGIGPARIRSVKVTYGGVPMPAADPLLQACCAPDYSPLRTVTADPVRVLVPGEEVVLLRYDRVGDVHPVFDALNRERWKIEVEACYCSILDECWIMHSRTPEPRPVEACPAVPEAERYRG